MDTKGGRFTLDINGAVFKGRGEATIMPARAVRTNATNEDGTGYSTVESRLASLELSFDRGTRVKWDEQMMLAEINVTFIETDVTGGVTHLFNKARWTGDPQLNTKTGELSGLKIETDSYQRIGRG